MALEPPLRLGRLVPWSAEEDALLRKLVGELGAKKWALIASRIPFKEPKQCRRAAVWRPAACALAGWVSVDASAPRARHSSA